MTLRNLAAVLLLISAASVCFEPRTLAWSQEATEAATETDSGKEADAKEEADSPSVPDQIQQHLKDGKPAQAAKLLNEALESDDGNAELHRLHQSVAFGFLRIRNYEGATKQLTQWFDSELPRTDSPSRAKLLASIVQQMSVYGARGKQADTVAKVTDQAIERCRELESEHLVQIQSTLAQLIGMRASMLSREDEASARELVAGQIEKLDKINGSDDASEETVSAAISLLTSSARLFKDSDAAERVESMFQQALETYPESEMLINQYAIHEYSTIGMMSQEDPEAASQRMEAAVAKLTPYAEEYRGVQNTLRRIESLESRIEAARKQLAMIGKPAPELDIDGWANADVANADTLKGKVVLYDFWAIWCGPCIATFPHLREWREEFGEQGFEIVGITRYYGYSWDEENGKAVRSKGDVDPEVEREAIGKFLQSKDMGHPSIVTPKSSELQKAYGVTGIPHAVLIDRLGNIQMIKVGSGQTNADALHAKIKELIAE